MKTDRYQKWLGPAILLLAVLPAGALLELTAGGGPWRWTVRGFLILSLVLVAVYVYLVHLPTQQVARQLREVRRKCGEQEEAMTGMLHQLRYGDLVDARRGLEDLPAGLSGPAEAALTAIGALVQQIQSVSVEVAGTANAVQETSAQLASGSSEQAAAVVEITATMEELARTAGLIAANAVGQADLSKQSVTAGRSGAAAAEAAVAGIDALRQRMETIASRAETLDSRSREIYGVLTLITEIAQETHILSLNAAIEASAAGEYGDRFGVVALEVRRLAERSKESVENIRTLLDEFAGAIGAVVFATEEGLKASEQADTESRSTAAAIEQLSSALGETAHAAQEISLATQEQQTASNEVVVTVKEESEVIQQMADGLADFTSAAERLNHLALSIQLLSQSFRLDSVHSLKNMVMDMGEEVKNFAGNIEAVEGVFRDAFGRFPCLEMAYIVDREGQMVAYETNRSLLGEDVEKNVINTGQVFSDRPWFQAVGRDMKTAVTPIYDSLLTGEDCFTVAAAVSDLEGEVVGTLGVDVNVRNWTRI